MAVIDIKGVRIGACIPKTIVSVMGRDHRDLMDKLGAIGVPGVGLGGPDCIEWRADAMADVTDPDAYAGICFFLSEELVAQPLIFTCRTKGQGGMADLSAAELANILRAVITTGEPDFVDIELWMGDEDVRALVQLAHAYGVRAIVSHHDFAGTPSEDEMRRLLTHMVELGADICKLAVMAHDADDADRLVHATLDARREVDAVLLTLAMGEAGSFTRVTGEAFGSALTFCALHGQASAPGQVELREAVQTMAEVHERLMQEYGEA